MRHNQHKRILGIRGTDGLYRRVIRLGNTTEISTRDDHGRLREVVRTTLGPANNVLCKTSTYY